MAPGGCRVWTSPTRAGQSGELALQRSRAWEVPSSHLSVPVGPEQAAAGRMKRGLQAQREGWRSSAAQGEGGARHDFGESRGVHVTVARSCVLPRSGTDRRSR